MARKNGAMAGALGPSDVNDYYKEAPHKHAGPPGNADQS